MTDGPFKSMSPDPDTAKYLGEDVIQCDECGGLVFHGDWPFCQGKKENHIR